MAKSARGSRKPRETKDDSKSFGSDKLTSAVFEGGRMYDHRKLKDQRDFQAAVKSGKVSKEALQNLANKGAVSGYGTKAATKKSQEEAAHEPEVDTVEQAQFEQQLAEEEE